MSDDPKIIVDEDWKTQVQAEKEAAKSGGPPDRKPDTAAKEEKKPADESELFSMLVSSLATQALMALGQFPDPETGHPVVRPDAAKPVIDTLSMLEAKTKGNLTNDEAHMLDSVLHELRMMFLAVRNHKQQPASKPAADKPAAEGDQTSK